MYICIYLKQWAVKQPVVMKPRPNKNEQNCVLLPNICHNIKGILYNKYFVLYSYNMTVVVSKNELNDTASLQVRVRVRA